MRCHVVIAMPVKEQMAVSILSCEGDAPKGLPEEGKSAEPFELGPLWLTASLEAHCAPCGSLRLDNWQLIPILSKSSKY